jgi:hypothetical protein
MQNDIMENVSDVADAIVRQYKSERNYASMETIMFSVLLKLENWHPEAYKDIVEKMGVKL